MPIPNTRKLESSALRHAYERFIAGRPSLEKAYEKAYFDSEVASLLTELRTGVGLTQRELAAKVGTSASVICRLENADYEGHSLAMLRRIAEALNHRLELRFVPERKPRRPRPRKAA